MNSCSTAAYINVIFSSLWASETLTRLFYLKTALEPTRLMSELITSAV